MIGFGKTEDGRDLCLRAPFTPFFFVKVPDTKQSPMASRYFASRVYDSVRGGLCKHLCRVMHRVPFIGFTNREPKAFVQLVFDSLEAAKQAKYMLRRQHTLFETNVDPMLKAFHIYDLDPVGWVRVATWSSVADDQSVSTVQEVRCSSMSSISMLRDNSDPPPLVVASWDIECVSDTGHFPDSSLVRDRIITIGTAYAMFESPDQPFLKTVHQLGTCHPIEGVEVHCHDKEHQLINAWIRETVDMRTDILLGYNTYGFDHRYLDGRAACLVDFGSGQPRVRLEEWGKMKEDHGYNGRPVEKNLTSSAYGDNSYFYHDTPGMLSVDLLQIYRKELKMESYTLDNMCRTYLDNMTKIDLKPHEIFRKQREEAPDGRTQIAAYCIRDVELPLRLAKKLNNLNNLVEFSKATCVPMDFLLVRGQQIRCLSLIARKAKTMGYLINDTQQHGRFGDDAGGDDIPFVGATVLEPSVGAYMDEVVSVLDFASLYPSIMMAHCLCPTTLVADERWAAVEGVEYFRVDVAPGHTVAFAQTPDYAVIPSLLADLKQYRKKAKRQMALAAQEGDDVAESLYNSKQLSFKVSMNSVYGFFGVSKGLLTGLKAISSSVCAIGRQMIYTTKRMVEQAGHRVIYGDTDSVLCVLNLGEDKARDLKAHFQAAEALAAEITKVFKAPNELEFEKCYSPYLIYSKKRYTGLCYTSPDKPPKQDTKGLTLVRRDNAALVRRISTSVLEKLLYERSFDKALECAQRSIIDVLEDRVGWDDFIVSKSLRRDYKNPGALPHVVVAEKRRQRGNPCEYGSRVPYVYVLDSTNQDLITSKRAECPEYAKEHGLQLDKLYYIRQQIINPISTLLSVTWPDAESKIMCHPAIQEKVMQLTSQEVSMVREAKRVRTNQKNKQREITSFFRR
jgi:DNA polymerase delta subunit 1